MWHRRFALVLAVSALLGRAPASHAQELKREGLRELAADLAKRSRAAAEHLKHDGLRVGDFSPSGDVKDLGHCGVGLMAELGQALQGFARPGAALELRGEYGLVASTDNARVKIIVVKAKLIRADNLEEVKEF